MSMAIFSRNTDEAVHLRDLFIKMLPAYGIVTDCVAYSDQNALSADTLQKDFRYGLICCESETDLLLALAMMKPVSYPHLMLPFAALQKLRIGAAR